MVQYLQTYGDGGAEPLLNGADSAFIAPDVLQHATVSIPTSSVTGMYATPVTLVPAVANHTIIVHKLVLTTVPGSTAFTGGGNVVAQYHTGAVAATGTVAASQVTSASASVNSVLPVAAAAVQGTQLELTNATAAFATGNGSLTADVWYSIL